MNDLVMEAIVKGGLTGELVTIESPGERLWLLRRCERSLGGIHLRTSTLTYLLKPISLLGDLN